MAVLPDGGLLLVGQDDRAKDAVRPVDGDHAVGRGGIVEDAVAGAEDLGVLADLDLEAAFHDEVELLPAVGVLVDGGVLLRLGIFIAHPVGVRLAVFEQRRDGADLGAGLVARELAAAAARDGVAGQARRGALQQLHHLHAEGHGALVDKAEGQIGPAGLVGPIVLHRKARNICNNGLFKILFHFGQFVFYNMLNARILKPYGVNHSVFAFGNSWRWIAEARFPGCALKRKRA